MYRVEMYARVRRACRVEGMSTREASRVFGLDRKTVRKMLSFSVPPGYRRGKPPTAAEAGSVHGDHRSDSGRRSDQPPQATAHGEADLRPSPGRVRVHRRLHHREGLCP